MAKQIIVHGKERSEESVIAELRENNVRTTTIPHYVTLYHLSDNGTYIVGSTQIWAVFPDRQIAVWQGEMEYETNINAWNPDRVLYNGDIVQYLYRMSATSVHDAELNAKHCIGFSKVTTETVIETLCSHSVRSQPTKTCVTCGVKSAFLPTRDHKGHRR